MKPKLNKKKFNSLPQSFGWGQPNSYRATQNNGTRRKISPRIYEQERHLDVRDRQLLSASTADLYRNCGIITFAVNKHLDYISAFSFQSKTKNKQFNKTIQQKIKWWSRASNCDISKRFTLAQFIRLAQKSRMMGGDCLVIKVKGQKIQLIQSDQIANPTIAIDEQQFGKIDLKNYTQGLKINKLTGAIEQYLICERGVDGIQRELLARVKAEDAIFLAYRPRASSWRGSSLLAPIVNSAKDIMDSQAYQLMKIRLTSLMTLAFYRTGQEDLPQGLQNGGGSTGSPTLDFTSEKPNVIDLYQGDKLEVVQSATPATETQNYYEVMTLQILRALDIPMSFYKQNYSTFYGSKAAAMAYSKSCEHKQQSLIDMLDEITRWLVAQWVMSGQIQIPKGMSINDIAFDWVPSGAGLWKPSEEMMGVGMQVALGQTTLAAAAREAGLNYYDNIDQIAKQLEYAKQAGVNIILPNINSNINVNLSPQENNNAANG